MTSPTKKTKPKNISITANYETHQVFEGLNICPAQLTGEFCGCKDLATMGKLYLLK